MTADLKTLAERVEGLTLTCSLCRGSGSLFAVQAKTREWWTCPACGGEGARSMFGPASIRSHANDKGRATLRALGESHER